MQPDTDNTEQYGYGITRTLIDDNTIVIVRTQGDMSRNAINTWASLIILTMQEWDSERPLAMLHNLSHPQQGYTPFSQKRTQDIVNARPEGLKVYSAVVLPRTFMYHIIEMFSRTPIFKASGQLIKFFNTEAQAIIWLREQLAKH